MARTKNPKGVPMFATSLVTRAACAFPLLAAATYFGARLLAVVVTA